jgi:hypothetical protein
MNIYGHALESADKEAANQFDNLFGTKTSEGQA